jgi:phosphoadenosine phosphosulfate reductase
MRLVLRQREVSADDWTHFEADRAPDADADALIVPLIELRTDEARWQAWPGRLGVRIQPADKVESLAGELDRYALIAVEFPTPSEGRGYTQGRLLRGRLGFTGELRAVGGAVKRDLIFALARCGFDAFELAAAEDPAACIAALGRYTVAYQPAVAGSSPQRLRFSV